MRPDFGRTASDYRRFRAGFPESFFAELQRMGIGRPGQRVLDLGTGTGTIARGIARRGGAVTGLDVAAPLLESARGLDAQAGLKVGYVRSRAEKTGFAQRSFDVVTAGQCWHWFDRQAAAAEVRRVLKPNGALVIAHYDWIPLRGNIVEATEDLIARHNPEWNLGGGTGVYPEWFRDLGNAGFVRLISRTYEEQERYTHEGWRGRIRASAGIGGSLDPARIDEFDRELAKLLDSRFPEPVSIPHRVFLLCASSPDIVLPAS